MKPGAVRRSRFGRGADRRRAARASGPDRRRGEIDWLGLFRGTDAKAVSRILHDCEVIQLPAGTPLLEPGQLNDSVYLVLSGALAAQLDSTLDFDSAVPIGPGECVGELSAIDGKPVSALVRATADSRVLLLPRALFWERLIAIPGVARNLLAALAERMRRSNESMLEAQRKQLALEHLRQELEVARSLQAGMLPLRRPLFPDRPDVEIAGTMEPASMVGGDLFDAFFVDDGRLFLCVGDVSGHGVPAALFMARAVGLMRVAAMATARPEELLERVNEQLCQGNETSMFATLFCAFYEPASGRLVYSNGGHCAPLLLGPGTATQLDLPRGTLTGAIPGLRYQAMEIVLEPGETLVCFTDGASEAENAAGVAFTEERLLSAAAGRTQMPVDALLDDLRRELADFTGGAALEDDCTFLALRHPVRTA